MSEPLDFSISKDRLVWVIVCSALVLILLFGAGVATGFLLASHAPNENELRRERNSLKDSSKAKGSKKGGAPQSASAATATPASAAKPGAPPAAAKAPAAPVSPASTDQRLTIEAASFASEHEASHLASLLERDGYRPVSTGQDPAAANPSYYVRLGPYRSWEQASRIATELERSYDLHTSVRPTSTLN